MFNRIIEASIVIGVLASAFVIGLTILIATTAANAAPVATFYLTPITCTASNPHGHPYFHNRPVCGRPPVKEGCTEDTAV